MSKQADAGGVNWIRGIDYAGDSEWGVEWYDSWPGRAAKNGRGFKIQKASNLGEGRLPVRWFENGDTTVKGECEWWGQFKDTCGCV